MRHVIEVFDAGTEELLQSVEIPKSYSTQLSELMGWTQPEDPYDGYDLSSEQVEVLERWTSTALNGDNVIIQIVCLE
ncbi:DUF7683 domain-containing protein [Pseudomonas sp. Z1-29]|uniref:DUF7683 domain-containing protein n=1 Tax=unclassified Pseudomonas TaxID=196821 RepID=UPI003DAA2039